MKLIFQTLCVALFLASCQKTLTHEKEVTTAVVASEANSPLQSHSLTFRSDYPVKPGEVPPFSFTKTQYPDARIKTIRMLSRAYPIHPAFPKHAVELNGTFTYAANTGEGKEQAPHLAFLKGTNEVWEYYKKPNGTGAKRLIKKWNVDLKFYINYYGYCIRVNDHRFPVASMFPPQQTLAVNYDKYHPEFIQDIVVYVRDETGYILGGAVHAATRDEYGNVTGLQTSPVGGGGDYHPDYPALELLKPSGVQFSYDYLQPRALRNLSFIPTQNLISQEFSLLEVMQWLAQPTHLRKTGAGIFYLPAGDKIVQSQAYKNYMFDANGNQTSLTYGDNVLQKITWHVQN